MKLVGHLSSSRNKSSLTLTVRLRASVPRGLRLFRSHRATVRQRRITPMSYRAPNTTVAGPKVRLECWWTNSRPVPDVVDLMVQDRPTG